ncbi:MAG: single-stranded DNA-binding protein [Saprospiraceae bacterium]|nr:single-stranded DNA-binding protein [Saprospiraceae bacterium]
MINRVVLIGNLGQDPEIRHLENGASVARFSVATNENYRDRDGNWQTITDWHDVVAWRNLAERAEKNLKKGMTIYVEGKLKHRKWQDKEGNNRKTTEVVADYFRILSKREGTEGSQQGQGNWPSTAQEPAQTTYSSTPDTGGGGADDLPF